MFPDPITCHIITLSDRASQGTYEDLSGPTIQELLTDFANTKNLSISVSRSLIPDDPFKLETIIDQQVDKKTSIIITTGGTGIGPKDFTPDVVGKKLQKEIPGIMDMIRVKYGMQKPNALISRSIAGIIEYSLIYVLPGSVKAVREYCQEVFPTISHSLKMLHGIDDHS
jgi:molybdopterin adenylyltransferase